MVSTEERSWDLHSFFSESMFPAPNCDEVERPFLFESRLEARQLGSKLARNGF